MMKKNIMTDLMFQGSFIIVANGDMTRMRYSGEKLEEAQAVYERSFDLSTSIEGRVQKPLVGTAAAAY